MIADVRENVILNRQKGRPSCIISENYNNVLKQRGLKIQNSTFTYQKLIRIV